MIIKKIIILCKKKNNLKQIVNVLTSINYEYDFEYEKNKIYTAVIVNQEDFTKEYLKKLLKNKKQAYIVLQRNININIKNIAYLKNNQIYNESIMKQINFCKNYYSERKNKDLDKVIIGKHKSMSKVKDLIKKVAKTNTTVLILGESGTGKELIAQSIHKLSQRSEQKLITINCGAIPKDLLESELFGHEKGSFTGAITNKKGKFEEADKGTIFLDEIGDMDIAMQVKLLRVLQEMTVEKVGSNLSTKIDVRVIAATHRNLEQMIEQELFREDLFYRINVFPINLPSLNNRIEDVPLIIKKICKDIEIQQEIFPKFSDDAIDFLSKKKWKGNIRELANLIERLSIIYGSNLINSKDIIKNEINNKKINQEIYKRNDIKILQNEIEKINNADTNFIINKNNSLKENLVNMEISMIKKALKKAEGVVSKAARILKVQRTTLIEKIKKYNIHNKT